MNFPIICSLAALFAMDGVTKVAFTSIAGAVLGALVGFLLGSAWYTVFHSVGADDLFILTKWKVMQLYVKRPSKQTFKCSVYKNGKLVSSNIA